ERAHRHLVSSTRFVFNYARAYREFGDAAYLRAAEHGLDFLRSAHRDDSSGAYWWTLRNGAPEDRTRHAYGMAFVLLAYSTAVEAGIEAARPWLAETWDVLERHFWDAEHGLY